MTLFDSPFSISCHTISVGTAHDAGRCRPWPSDVLPNRAFMLMRGSEADRAGQCPTHCGPISLFGRSRLNYFGTVGIGRRPSQQSDALERGSAILLRFFTRETPSRRRRAFGAGAGRWKGKAKSRGDRAPWQFVH